MKYILSIFSFRKRVEDLCDVGGEGGVVGE